MSKDSGQRVIRVDFTMIGPSFVTKFWETVPGDYFFISTKRWDGSPTGIWTDHPFHRDEFHKIPAFIRKHLDCDLYFCPHGYSDPRRHSMSAVTPCVLWADLDGARPQKMRPRPTIALESSPGRYVGFWQLDREMTRELNQHLNYHVGADPGGWGFTKVLRIPGTYNYKKEYDEPCVKILWDDGPEYKFDDIERIVGKAIKPIKANKGNPAEIFKKYEKRIPSKTRSLIRQRHKPERGSDRSRVLFGIEKDLLEAGMSQDEVFDVVVVSVWNKFGHKHDQLRRDIEKAAAEVIDRTPMTARRDEDDEEFTRRPRDERLFAGMKEEKTEFLWAPYIPSEEITLMAGQGNIGKGLVSAYLAACVSQGINFLEDTDCEPGGVIWGESEDHLNKTVLPRLIAAEADLSRVEEMNPQELMRGDMRDYIIENNIKLIILNPILSWIELANINNELEVRAALTGVLDMIRGTGCAILGIVHLNKKSDLNALDRITGSVAFKNFCRSTLVMDYDDEEHTVVRLAHGKHNISERGNDLLIYRMSARPELKGRHPYWKVEIEQAETNESVGDMFNRKKKESTETAGGWLIDYLTKNGRTEVSRIIEDGKMRNFGKDALRQAQQRSNGKIKHHRDGYQGPVSWYV